MIHPVSSETYSEQVLHRLDMPSHWLEKVCFEGCRFETVVLKIVTSRRHNFPPVNLLTVLFITATSA